MHSQAAQCAQQESRDRGSEDPATRGRAGNGRAQLEREGGREIVDFYQDETFQGARCVANAGGFFFGVGRKRTGEEHGARLSSSKGS